MADVFFSHNLSKFPMSKFLVNFIVFAFAPIGTWINLFTAFAFRPMEAPQHVYMLLQLLVHSHCIFIICIWNLNLKLVYSFDGVIRH